MIDTSELDCIKVVETIPKLRLFQSLLVVFRSSLSNTPPVNARKPSSSESIPKRKIETPAAISLKSGLSQKPKARTDKIVRRRNFLSTVALSIGLHHLGFNHSIF
jgi:hypothetical protein